MTQEPASVPTTGLEARVLKEPIEPSPPRPQRRSSLGDPASHDRPRITLQHLGQISRELQHQRHIADTASRETLRLKQALRDLQQRVHAAEVARAEFQRLEQTRQQRHRQAHAAEMVAATEIQRLEQTRQELQHQQLIADAASKEVQRLEQVHQELQRQARAAEVAAARATEIQRLEPTHQELQRQARTAEAHRMATGSLLAREHELARWKARQIPGETAGAELAQRLSFAHRHAGKPSLTKLSQRVGYSKGSLSKVLNGKMPPTWTLVRKLGEHLRVPQQHVTQEWLPLWISADEYRQAARQAAHGAATTPTDHSEAKHLAVIDASTGTAPSTTAPTEQAGYACPMCGSWVVDTARHTEWHMRRDPTGRTAPDAESTGALANTAELKLLREALGPHDA